MGEIDMIRRSSTRPLALVLALFAVALTPAVAHADEKPPVAQPQQAHWEKLGERSVDGKIDHDAINVGRDDGLFDAIQVKVEGSALVMFDIKVTFGNGETFEPKTRLVFEKDTRSRVIDLPGNTRAIKRVDFKLANLPGGGKARVELWGKDVTPPPAWHRVAQRQVDGKIDRDVLTLDDGVYTALQFRVEGSSLAMFDIKVTFGNGETFEPKTRLVFDKDSRSRVIDLPGNTRSIKRIELRYANLPGGGKAQVEVWGK
jgi:hypothetical protein